MPTAAQVQSVASAIAASLETLQRDVVAEDSAIPAVLEWARVTPGVLPDTLVEKLDSLKNIIDGVATDIRTQVDKLATGPRDK